jgi:sugar phosphate isomerase/epimerase
MMNRRNFIQTAAFAAVGGSLLTQETFAKQKIKSPGIQLYTVRNELGKDFEGTLKAVAAAGYKEFEFFGNYYGKDPKAVKTMLAAMGVTAPAGHFSLAALKKDVNEVIDIAKSVGHNIVICPFLMPNERKTLDDYKKLCDVLNKSGEACKKAGLTFGYHNHDFEFKELEGKLPYDLILTECDKNTVKMELDLGWISHAGKDPLEYFAKHPGRFITFHVKDMDASQKQITMELGRGKVDFKRILAKSKLAGVKHYFVEQDNTSLTALESIKISMEYLKKLEF